MLVEQHLAETEYEDQRDCGTAHYGEQEHIDFVDMRAGIGTSVKSFDPASRSALYDMRREIEALARSNM